MLASFVIGDGRRIRGDRAAAAANLTSRMNTSRCTGHASTVVPDDEVNVDERAVVGAAHDMLERPACPSPLIALGLASRTCAACGSRMRAIGSARSVASSTTSSLPRLCAKSSELGWIRRHPASVSHVATVLRYRDLAEARWTSSVAQAPCPSEDRPCARVWKRLCDPLRCGRGQGNRERHRTCGVPLLRDAARADGRRPRDVTAVPEHRRRPRRLDAMEPLLPAPRPRVQACWLVQLPELVAPEDIFTEYAYFSGYSTSWVEHARLYVEMIRERLELGPDDLVVELASNDGYLLQHFVGTRHPGARDRPCGQRREGGGGARRADARRVLRARGGANAWRRGEAREPHRRKQRPRPGAGPERLRRRRGDPARAETERRRSSFRTCSACSTGAVRHDLPRALLVLLVRDDRRDPSRARPRRPTTSRSCRRTAARCASTPSTRAARTREHGGRRCAARARGRRQGCASPERYARFAEDVKESKRALLELLIALRREGKQVVGYGAPGKGNTLLNYCGIRTDLLDYTVDRNPYKQGTYTPGHAHPDPSRRSASRRRGRTTSSCCRGTSSTRSRRSSPTSPNGARS